MKIPFDNSYARLPERFFARTSPVRVPEPALIAWNEALSAELNILADPSDTSLLARVFSGNQLPEGADPVAQAYAGHQFGQFVPQLGDGRAVLLGEVVDQHGQRRDIQLKGAGRTPFSRGGDGRAPIGPVLREYLVSEAMHALGVPTTRALAAVRTGESVFRDYAQPGAIITRIAASHIRIGTFQYFAARGDQEALNTLVDHSLARHYPDALPQAPKEMPASMVLLEQVVARQAQLVAHWMSLGFIHGVMNTDNMTISGETIDYGPCAFMEQYDPQTVFSAIDRDGRYAWHNQPRIAQWNLARLAEALLNANDDPSSALPEAERLIGSFMPQYEAAWRQRMGGKLGLHQLDESDDALIQQLLDELYQQQADFTQSFHQLIARRTHAQAPTVVSAQWLSAWLDRLAQADTTVDEQVAVMRQSSPSVIPRNHLVAEVIAAAEDDADYAPFQRLLAVVTAPQHAPEDARLMQPAEPQERVFRTFCGT
ncbi:YdiU family protein [Salinispirillum sp. LH 10-3-1]|uniref:Protein nucleotidyltransferase YdiU n=1 Tax=Salinispirillum sp. LH 10-3-1 TaxID=2952525 RepID=A0AB38YE94_9GAMM